MDYNQLANKESLDKTIKALQEKGYNVLVTENGADALFKIKELIPQGASVMNGSSKTLEEVGFIDYLKTDITGWINLHEKILMEKDPAKQKIARREALTSDFYLGSVHALTEDGQMVIGSNSGSQLPHLVFSSPNLILVIGTQKIVPNFDDAMKRLESYVVPLEDAHMMSLYKIGTELNKVVIFKSENQRSGRKINIILVNEVLGF